MRAVESSHFLISASVNLSEAPEDIFFRDISVLNHMKQITFHPKVTFFVGQNGAGKSTLLEALAVGMGLNPEGGSRNFNFATAETHSSLHEYMTIVKGIKRPKDTFFLRAESFYNVATKVDGLSAYGRDRQFMHQYGGRSLHEQSHGESFLSLMKHRMRGGGLYFFDEPEAALSPQGQMSFLVRLHELAEQGAQCIIATHSPIIMAYPQADILEFTDTIEKTAYESTQHVQLMRDFIQHPEMMMDKLLSC